MSRRKRTCKRHWRSRAKSGVTGSCVALTRYEPGEPIRHRVGAGLAPALGWCSFATEPQECYHYSKEIEARIAAWGIGSFTYKAVRKHCEGKSMTETSLPAGLERRREDIELITGHSHYVDDLRSPAGRPPALHMVVVRSPYAHAEIKDIRIDGARSVPGVIAVFTSEELVSDMRPMDVIPMPGLKKPERRPLAVGRVRYVGDPVAVVLAENLYAAEDARDLVDVEYEPLPAVTDPEAALAAGAPLLYDEFGSNLAYLVPSGGGDIAAAFAHETHCPLFWASTAAIFMFITPRWEAALAPKQPSSAKRLSRPRWP